MDLNYGIKPYLWVNPKVDTWIRQTDGQMLLDNTFDPANPKNQVRLAEICDEIYKIPEFKNVYCPMGSFRGWFKAKHPRLWPVPEKLFHKLYAEFVF